MHTCSMHVATIIYVEHAISSILQLSKNEVIEVVAAELEKYPGNELKQELVLLLSPLESSLYHFYLKLLIVQRNTSLSCQSPRPECQ